MDKPRSTIIIRPPADGQITREMLSDQSLVDAFRAGAPSGTRFFTEQEQQASIDHIMASHAADADVHVFGYGSLMWNPAFHFADACAATVSGWRRRFCIRLQMARGSPEQPGVMLGLDRGGACRGIAYRIPRRSARQELSLLWRREMMTGVYQARWVTARTASGPLRVLAFVVNRGHQRYLSELTENDIAAFIMRGTGNLGTCRDYFDNMIASMHQLGIRDRGIERIRAAVLRLSAAPPSA